MLYTGGGGIFLIFGAVLYFRLKSRVKKAVKILRQKGLENKFEFHHYKIIRYELLDAFDALESSTDSKNTESKPKYSTPKARRDTIKYLINLLNPKNIESFLDSSDFRQNYATHPYPPLINPNAINYDKIPAQIAWILNLPLPQNYQLIFFTNGASASDITTFWLQKSRVNATDCWLNDKEKYEQSYKILSKHKNGYNVLVLTEKNKKTLLLSRNKNKILYIARDPISRYKVGINHLRVDCMDALKAQNVLSTRFNLTCEPRNTFVEYRYWLNCNVAHFGTLSNRYVEAIDTYIVATSIFKEIERFGLLDSVYVVDFNDLSASKAQSTFNAIASHFGFVPLEDSQYFIDKKWGYVAPFLPVTLHANSYDIPNLFDGKYARQNLETLNINEWSFTIDSNILNALDSKYDPAKYESLDIHIGLYDDFKNGDFIDISDKFFKQKVMIDKATIFIYISKNDIKMLENNELLNAARIYIKEYLKALESKVENEKSHIINETQILQYLESNKTLRDEIKNLFDKELEYFKLHHKDIVNTWVYYQAFEEMCKNNS